ncbi:MAG: histidine kinase dimerization/phosphoacceptor domain -containing protein [Methanoregula sp.]
MNRPPLHPLLRAGIIAGTTLGVILLSVFSLMNGEHSIFPYFLLIPVLLVVWFYPKYGVVYTVLLGWIYMTLVYYYFSRDLFILARSTAWFYMVISIGIVISSFASGRQREERKYHTIFEYSQAGLFTGDLKRGIITDANPQCSIFLGYEREHLRGREIRSLWYSDASREQFLHLLHEQGHVENYEVQLRTQQAAPVWGLLSAAFTDGESAVFSVVDITDRKTAEETLKRFNAALEEGIRRRTAELDRALHEKEILLREVHHRVKNNLQLMESLLSLQAGHASDPGIRHAIRESQNRVRAMAAAHQGLYDRSDSMEIGLSEYLHHIVLRLYYDTGKDSRDIRPEIDVNDIMTGIGTAIIVGLIVTELVTNSLRYGFPEGQTGTITIHGRREDKKIVLTIGDDGTGLPPGTGWKNPHSLGLKIVALLVQQARGTIELLPGKGTVFLITVEEQPNITVHAVSDVN